SIYGPALNIVNMLFLVPNALYITVLPALAKAFASNQDGFFRIGKTQLCLQLLNGFMMTIGLCLLSPLLIRLCLGSAYLPSVAILRLLSPLVFLKSINFGLAAILTSANLQLWRTTAQLVSALFNVVANLIVIIPFGITGVAWVYLLSESLLLFGYIYPVYNWFFRRQ
ncbi:MAG: polysaccharide biosynthesis C-terminal domain-containing protein, partial [Anaerolineae bacterium]